MARIFGKLALVAAVLAVWAGVVSPVRAADAESPAAAVKVTQPMAIDGAADDWAGITASHSIAVPGKNQTVATFKLAYDAAGFYALVEVKDDSPLKNKSNVQEELLKGGDAIGLCFGTVGGQGANQRIMAAQIDGQPVIMALRPVWPVKKPHTFTSITSVTMDYVGPVTGAKAAFKPVADGYVAELSIPWKELGLRPTDGGQFAFDVQVIFSDPGGTLNRETSWWHSTGSGPLATMDLATEAKLYPEAWGAAKLYAVDPGPTVVATDAQTPQANGVPITFDLPRDAKVSVILRREDGWVIRELVQCTNMTKGAHTILWDGRNRWGEPMPPGKYSYRVAYFDPIKATFYGSVGNSGRPVYRTADGMGSIGGTHGGPTSLAADADGIYMLHSVEEGQKCLRKIDPATGKAKWFYSLGGFGAGLAIAAESQSAYLVAGRGNEMRIVRLDSATGKKLDMGGKQEIPLGKTVVESMAVVGSKLFFSVPKENRVGVANLQSGSLEKDIAVESPRGVCRLDDRSLLVCSGKQVLKMDSSNGSAAPLLKDLEQPAAVAVDKAGVLYVSDLGTSQQIKRFAADGKPLGTIGKPGGRAPTVVQYDPMELQNVGALAIGPDGNLWMLERSAIRRFAKFNHRWQMAGGFLRPG